MYPIQKMQRQNRRHRGQASLLQKMRNLLPHSTHLPVAAAEGCDKAAGLQRPQDPAPPSGSIAASQARQRLQGATQPQAGRQAAVLLLLWLLI